MYLAFAILGGPAPVAAAHEPQVQHLVAAARQGSQGAARQLYSLHVRQVFRAVRPLCFHDSEAEDLVQETFIKALGSLESYHRRPGTRFISWVLTIAMNLARKGLRHHRRVQAVAPEDLDARGGAVGQRPVDPAGDAMDLQLQKRALLTALGELSERERQVVTLRYGACLSAGEVGEITGLSQSNVRKICQRQRALLHKRLRSLLEGAEAVGWTPQTEKQTAPPEEEGNHE